MQPVYSCNRLYLHPNNNSRKQYVVVKQSRGTFASVGVTTSYFANKICQGLFVKNF